MLAAYSFEDFFDGQLEHALQGFYAFCHLHVLAAEPQELYFDGDAFLLGFAFGEEFDEFIFGLNVEFIWFKESHGDGLELGLSVEGSQVESGSYLGQDGVLVCVRESQVEHFDDERVFGGVEWVVVGLPEVQQLGVEFVGVVVGNGKFDYDEMSLGNVTAEQEVQILEI